MDIKEFDTIVSKMLDYRHRRTELTQKAKDLQAKYDGLKLKVIAELEGEGLDKFAGSVGTVSLVRKESVKMPQDISGKKELLEYFRDNGIFYEMVTVHSQRLNSWFKAEKESRIDSGDLDWQAPGIDEVKQWTDIQLRSK